MSKEGRYSEDEIPEDFENAVFYLSIVFIAFSLIEIETYHIIFFPDVKEALRCCCIPTLVIV